MTNLVRRNGFGLQNRGFEDFYNMMDSFFNEEFPSKRTNMESFKVDIIENDNEYTVEAELPGFEKEDISIEFDEGRLTLKAEKSESIDESDKSKNYIHRERKMSKVSRRMYFKDVDEENIKASLDKGVLNIQIPKKADLQRVKNIQID